MSKVNQKLSLLQLFTLVSALLLSSCYNNTHFRTQRVLEEGDKVISIHGSSNLLAPTTSSDSYRMSYSGVQGLRVGASYLGMKGGFEQGPSAAFGWNGYQSSLNLGYDVRKVSTNASGTPLRSGIFAEINRLMSSPGFSISKSNGIQIRPYLSTTTSEEQDWYAGLHGLFSAGLTTVQIEEDYVYQLLEEYQYQSNVFGFGLTLGNENRKGEYIYQVQSDITWTSHNRQLSSLNSVERSGFSPFEEMGLVVSVGMAIHKAPASQRKLNANHNRILYPVPKTSSPQADYDPFTGQVIQKPSEKVLYDPLTGKRMDTVTEAKYDPYTGELVSPALDRIPTSLLTDSEIFLVMDKGLKITELNGRRMDAIFLNLTREGMVINQNLALGVADTVRYEEMVNLTLSGHRKGLGGAVRGAVSGCSAFVLLPIVFSIVSDSGEMATTAIVVSPFTLGASALYGALSRESYELTFDAAQSLHDRSEQNRIQLLQIVKLYALSDFPRDK